ncbi:hypothetical protein GCM10011611_27870 [Aliidongia dinghuensis]|uniref:Uncharacterized protein n=1 Tax=Aliidongia dinghuensis TaxID=1867774 RepID=A0A8J2YUI3_9PROT|nr:hypothetical protein [Aliidongia dinghuensis]GGF20310.1 hypothetical protein GCM10011611_27870 [Aliidongia dinghuensis]
MLSVGDMVQPGAIGASYGMSSYTVVPGTTPGSAALPSVPTPGALLQSAVPDPSAATGLGAAAAPGQADPTALAASAMPAGGALPTAGAPIPGASIPGASIPGASIPGASIPGASTPSLPAMPAAAPVDPANLPSLDGASPAITAAPNPSGDASGAPSRLQTIAGLVSDVVGG